MAITLLNQNSKDLILLNNPPTPDNVNAIIHAKMITGIPVPNEKTIGKYNPDALVITKGISMPK